MIRPLKLLIVAYHFPPTGGGYTERIAGYIKYLTTFGCRVFILTSGQERGVPLDVTRLKEVQSVAQIWRVRDIHESRLFAVLDRLHLFPFFDKAFNVLSCPDNRWIWAREALSVARQIITDEKIHIVLTTSAPYSSHLLGMRLRQEYQQLRWIADFRDPMTTNYAFRRLRRPPGWHSRAKAIEAQIYRSADRIIFNTPWNRNEIIDHFAIPKEKALCFVNGYDPQMLPASNTAQLRTDVFKLFYIGGLRGDWFEGAFYRALGVLRAKHPDLYSELEVNCVGAKSLDSALAKELQLNKDIVMHGFVTQEELHRYYDMAHGFLLLLPCMDGASGWVPQKLYNYLYCNKPIFAVIPEGQAAEYLRLTESGYVVSPSSPDAISEELAHMLTKYPIGASVNLQRSPKAREVVKRLGKPYLAREMNFSFHALINK